MGVLDYIGGVMVSILVSSAEDGGSGKTKVKIWYLLLLPKNAVVRNKSKDLLARNLENVFKLSDMSMRCVISVS